jgi:hypothetical protein
MSCQYSLYALDRRFGHQVLVTFRIYERWNGMAEMGAYWKNHWQRCVGWVITFIIFIPISIGNCREYCYLRSDSIPSQSIHALFSEASIYDYFVRHFSQVGLIIS